METFFAVAWLASIPFLVALGAFRSRYLSRIWRPTGRIQRFLVWAALAAMPLASVAHLLGYECRVAGLPMLGWAGLLLLAAFWWRLISVRTRHAPIAPSN